MNFVVDQEFGTKRKYFEKYEGIFFYFKLRIENDIEKLLDSSFLFFKKHLIIFCHFHTKIEEEKLTSLLFSICVKNSPFWIFLKMSDLSDLF